ncbi:MAG: AMP-binding protein, partial [Thermoanaerobaculia bacterium]
MSRSDLAKKQDERWRRWVHTPRSGSPPSADAWAAFQEIFAERPEEDGPPRVWEPVVETVARSNAGQLARERGLDGFEALHTWSVVEREGFWERVIERLGIVLDAPPRRILDDSLGAEHPVWLPGARLNTVASCFSDPERAARAAIVSGREGSAALGVVTAGDLQRRVETLSAGLMARGLGPRDAVGLYMPLNADCVAAYLALVALGCRTVPIAESLAAPEVRRRLEIGDVEAVLTQATYKRGGKEIDLLATVRAAGAPRTWVLPGPDGEMPELVGAERPWSELELAPGSAPLHIADPYAVTTVLFSSGTTGTPKAIPWNHLTPIKAAMDACFHQDVHPGDVLCWPTSLGWMMGPWLIWAALLNGATMALWEGSPTGPELTRFVERARVTMLGIVPSLVRAWRASGATDGADWRGVRVFSSTGEPSGPHDYVWLMGLGGFRAPVIEYCGGTEIGGGYVTGSVTLPASPACFSTPALGLDLALLDETGRPADEGEVFLAPPSIGLSQELLNADHHEVYFAGCPAGPEGEVLRRHGDSLERLP